MTEPSDVLSRRLRVSGTLISIGLAIEAATLFSLKALSFIAFAGGGAMLVLVGVLLFLYAVISR